MKKSLLIAFILLILMTGAALAQGSDPNNPHNLTPEQQAQAKEIQTELWCPICQGVRLDVCEQKVCQQMRDMIDEMLVEGKSKQEIIDEFVDQYGVVILGEPPKQGINIMAWLMPVLLVVVGLGFAFWMSKKWTQKNPAAAAVDTTAPPDSALADTTSAADDSDDIDDYLARVERELGEDL
jgi:cytochrome c-type biogenesis protein CcmH